MKKYAAITIHVLAILCLVAAYVSGYLIRDKEYLATMEASFPGKDIVRVGQNKVMYDLIDKETGQKEGSVLVESGQGWGGPFKLALAVDAKGRVQDLVVLHHTETPSFFQHLEVNGFFEQFSGKRLDEQFSLHEDIDAISGATISSVAFTKAAGTAAHWVGTNKFEMQVDEVTGPISFGSCEIILLGLYALIFLALLKKYQRARLYVLGFSVLFLGFYMNRPISISNIGGVLLGFVPSLHDQLFWWMLVVGVLVLTLLFGKNFYCFWMCPFGGLQEFVSRIGGVKLRMNLRVQGIMRNIVYVLLWAALMIIFITRNPANGNFEPFAVLFSLKGLGVQWYLVSLAMVGSILIPRFWCRFFCPVGAVLQKLSRVKGGTLRIRKYKEIRPEA